ncbi:hypothetical protein GX48_03418 [Paracoccidioides brasiliensis]|nr:hypothetical protein GX48_03418 [Paracoccidioides brasiliensis]
MDPLSIVKLIFLSEEIISICCTYGYACAEGLRKLVEETTAVSGLFVAIQGLLNADRFSTSQKEGLHNVLAECQGTLSKLKDVLQSLRTGPKKKKMEAMKRLLWLLKQAETTENLATLSQHRSSLNLLLALEATLEAQRTHIWWLAVKYRLLRIHGTPGSCKSVLLSDILNQCLLPKVSEKNVVDYYYCDFRNHDSCCPESVVGAIILQLCHTLHCLLVGVEDAFSRHIGKDGKADPASLEELEIVPGEVLVSGRREIDIIRLLKDQPKISTQGKDADENIHYYIRASVEGRPRLRKLKVVMQEHMVETLTQGAGGMFRWVKCQLDGLNRLSRVEKTYNLYPCTPTLPPSRSHRSSNTC